MTEAFEKLEQMWVDTHIGPGITDQEKRAIKWVAEVIKSNPALIWDTPPATASPDAVDIPVTGTESQANALPEGEESKAIPEPWMTDKEVFYEIMRYETKNPPSFIIRDKAQQQIDSFRSAYEYIHKCYDDMTVVYNDQRTRIAELEAMGGECRVQLEYLNEKFGETGTINKLLSMIKKIVP